MPCSHGQSDGEEDGSLSLLGKLLRNVGRAQETEQTGLRTGIYSRKPPLEEKRFLRGSWVVDARERENRGMDSWSILSRIIAMVLLFSDQLVMERTPTVVRSALY